MADKENEPDEIISLEAVREFLLKHNGRVCQTDLVNNFRQQLSSPATKVRARQEFKDILQLITAVKTENGDKYIVLTKQDHLQTSVINRKASRPLSVRKELAKSKIDYFQTFDQEDNASYNGSVSTLDSGFATETSSVASLRAAVSGKIKVSQSMDSIDTYMAEGEDDDLEDEIGLSEGSVVLPEEKEWMFASANGRLDAMKKLLQSYPDLPKKKDFVMGYTALHWAAKLGRTDIVKFIAGTGVDIHLKSHGGYTPLHIAALSGKDQVIIQLIELHGANIHARDHSGRKPRDVVKDTVAADVQRKLGRSMVLEPNMPTILLASLSPAIMHRIPRSTSNQSLEGETSPSSTPDIARRHLKSIGASAQRSMSFLKKKKKHEPRLRTLDIQHSPQIERRASEIEEGNQEQAGEDHVPWKKELASKKQHKKEKKTSTGEKSRPKSQINYSPTELEPTDGPRMSFEI